MLLLFFVAWIIFNGRITWEIVLFGIAISAAMFAFICKFMDYSWKKERAIYQKTPLIIKYIVLLVKEIIKANLAVCHLILTRKETVEPVIVKIHTNLKSETARVFLANSITLTPGTITVAMSDNELVVHCLDEGLAIGLENSSFEKLLMKIEKEEG